MVHPIIHILLFLISFILIMFGLFYPIKPKLLFTQRARLFNQTQKNEKLYALIYNIAGKKRSTIHFNDLSDEERKEIGIDKMENKIKTLLQIGADPQSRNKLDLNGFDNFQLAYTLDLDSTCEIMYPFIKSKTPPYFSAIYEPILVHAYKHKGDVQGQFKKTESLFNTILNHSTQMEIDDLNKYINSKKHNDYYYDMYKPQYKGGDMWHDLITRKFIPSNFSN